MVNSHWIWTEKFFVVFSCICMNNKAIKKPSKLEYNWQIHVICVCAWYGSVFVAVFRFVFVVSNVAFFQLENHSFAKPHTNEQTETSNQSHTALILNQIMTNKRGAFNKNVCWKRKQQQKAHTKKPNKTKNNQTISQHNLCKQNNGEKKAHAKSYICLKNKIKLNKLMGDKKISLNWCTNVDITACLTQKVINQHFDKHWWYFCPHIWWVCTLLCVFRCVRRIKSCIFVWRVVKKFCKWKIEIDGLLIDRTRAQMRLNLFEWYEYE